MEAGFDELIHQPTRLRLMALLYGLGHEARVEFGWLKRELDTTDGNLSVHLQKLEQAGYVRVEKEFVGRRPRTWVALTAQGQQAMRQHLQALEALVRAARGGHRHTEHARDQTPRPEADDLQPDGGPAAR